MIVRGITWISLLFFMFNGGAISWSQINDKERISIYISNVPIWIEYLNEWYNISESICQRPSSIYLPNKVIPMLNEILSNNICSLIAGKLRPVLSLDITLASNGCVEHNFNLAIIRVSNNYCYEDPMLNKLSMYNSLMKATEKLQKISTYVYSEKELDSHDLVAYYMIYMNHISAQILYDVKLGISRVHKCNSTTSINKINKIKPNISKIIDGYNGGSAKYVLSGSNTDTGHSMIGDGLDHYTHITSPIRRAVDLANMVTIQNTLGVMYYGDEAIRFVKNLMNNIDELNIATRNISRVQFDCNLLNLCTNYPDIINNIYSGIIIDKTRDKNNNLRYTLYLDRLNILYHYSNKFNIEQYQIELELYEKYDFSIHLFKDEHTLSRKIRLDLSNNKV